METISKCIRSTKDRPTFAEIMDAFNSDEKCKEKKLIAYKIAICKALAETDSETNEFLVKAVFI